MNSIGEFVGMDEEETDVAMANASAHSYLK
jgi:hypothetical protein